MNNKLEMEIKKFQSETIETPQVTEQLRKIHAEYEKECQEACLQIEEHYMKVEIDYLKSLRK
jgi:hypothetical protein